jgi:hypothetical protein
MRRRWPGLRDSIDRPFPYETIRGPFASPKWAHKRFRGTNIVSRPGDSGNFDPPSPTNMYKLCYDFCSEGETGPAWLRWIKPQIDAIHSIGGNFTRWYWDATILVGDSTHHGRAAWQGTVTEAQFRHGLSVYHNYLASLGMWSYPTAMEAAQLDTAASLGTGDGGLRLTTAQTMSYVDVYIDEIVTYPNVLAVDVLMEFVRADWSLEGTNLTALMNRAKAARGSSKLPLTCSIWDALAPAYPAVPDYATKVAIYDALMTRATTAGVDFFDLHIYELQQSGPFLNFLINNRWGLPWVIGEMGITQLGVYWGSGNVNETTHPFSSELVTREYQDIVASIGARYDLQILTNYGVTDQHPTNAGQWWGMFSQHQDATYAFDQPRANMIGPFQTIPTDPIAYNVVRTLDLTGADTVPAAWNANSSFGLGWSMYDLSNKFSRSSNRVKRANGSLGVGVLNFYDLPAIDQSISVDFDASQAVPSGGQIDWDVSVRHRALDTSKYYFADIASKPLDAVDGLLTIYRIDATISPGYALLASFTTPQPFNLTHRYRLSLSAAGVYPTRLTATLMDLTTVSVIKVLTATDSDPLLQTEGVLGLPSHIGEVYFTNVRMMSTANLSPSLSAPTLTASASTITAAWASAVGGLTPYLYVPEYCAVDANGFPTGNWIRLPAQSGTSVTITGLSNNTRYAVRIGCVDQSQAAA